MNNVTHLILEMPGEPQGKGRARAFLIKRGGRRGKIGHYTPEKTRTYEGIIRTFAMQGMSGRPPYECPIMLEMVATVSVPPSWSAWKTKLALEGGIVPTTKPDLDNIEKALKDALNTVVWRDDAQVVKVLKEKRYGENVGLWVRVDFLNTYPAQLKKKPA